MTPNSERICLLDMDGTIANFEGKLRADLEELRGPNEPEAVLSFDDDKIPKHIKARMRLIKESKNWWYDLPPLRSGFSLMNMAKDIGFDIHVLTKGPYKTSGAWTQKYEWCREFLPTDTKITITEDKGLMYGNILIDDYPGYMERWLTWRPRALGVMPITSYNKDFKHPNVVIFDGTNAEEVRERMQWQMDRQGGEELPEKTSPPASGIISELGRNNNPRNLDFWCTKCYAWMETTYCRGCYLTGFTIHKDQ